MHLRTAPCCDSHYGRGNREISTYHGPAYNLAGAGFFGDVFRKIIPIFTSKVLPYVGEKLLQTGRDVTKDISEGTSFRTALKRGVKRTLESGKEDVLRKLSGGGYKRARKSTAAHKLAIALSNRISKPRRQRAKKTALKRKRTSASAKRISKHRRVDFFSA